MIAALAGATGDNPWSGTSTIAVMFVSVNPLDTFISNKLTLKNSFRVLIFPSMRRTPGTDAGVPGTSTSNGIICISSGGCLRFPFPPLVLSHGMLMVFPFCEMSVFGGWQVIVTIGPSEKRLPTCPITGTERLAWCPPIVSDMANIDMWLANCNFASHRACNNVASSRCTLFISKALLILAKHRITSGLLTRDQSEVDSDLTDPRPFPPLMLVSLVRQRLSLRVGYFEN